MGGPAPGALIQAGAELTTQARGRSRLPWGGRQTFTTIPGEQAVPGPQAQCREAGQGCLRVTHPPFPSRVSMENEGKREPGEKRYLQSASVSHAAFCGQHVCECVCVNMCVCVYVCVLW